MTDVVGAPKHLSDLAKIEADVRITCRRCGFEEDWAREDLAAYLRSIGASRVWSKITDHLKCRRFGCGSVDLRALPVPYGRRPANLPRPIGKLDAKLIETALQILGDAVLRARGHAVATPAVNIALLVIHVYARDAATARLFWQRATATVRTVNEELSEPLEILKHRLRQRGWLVPHTVAVDLPRIWPWPSPAPPGWLAPPGHPRETETDK